MIILKSSPGLETFFTVSQQADLFIMSCIFGCAAGIIYDIFRILRIMIYHSHFFTALEDLLFLSAYAGFMILFTLEAARGEFRFYYAAGNLLGFAVYHFSAGNIITNMILKAVTKLKHFMSKHIIIPVKSSLYNKKYQKTLE